MNLEIANRLVALRKENHLSQEALAEKLGISRQAVSKWERAEASPDTDNLITLARLYNVSLDWLLKIQDEEEIETEEIETEEIETEEITIEEFEPEEVVIEELEPEEIEAEEIGEGEVHIGFQGIHVKELNGNEVHVGWDGIHVHDTDNDVHIDKHGVYVNDEKVEGHIFTRGKENPEFPLWFLAIVIYIVIGVCFGLWTPGWLIFFLVPVISSFTHAVRRRNAYLFAYPVLVVFIYLYVGLVYFTWHPTWVIFLTIPLYYSFVDYIQGKNWGKDEEEE